MMALASASKAVSEEGAVAVRERDICIDFVADKEQCWEGDHATRVRNTTLLKKI